MIGYCQSGAFLGAEVCPIHIEARTKPGKPVFHIIGLGDSAVRESRDRITSALRLSGFDVPDQILINLAPADLKKEGSGLDLAMALAILIADKQLPEVEPSWIFGELSLDGSVKPVKGVAGYASSAALSEVKTLIIPQANRQEASLVPDIDIIGVGSLEELRDYLQEGVLKDDEVLEPSSFEQDVEEHLGFETVVGQDEVKKALEITAAGGHNALMVGPPGCGKSMLAERFVSLLPPLISDQKLECIKIASIVGREIDGFLKGIPPYRSPHHVISEVGMVGGGSTLRPGEISLAHHGVLFLDEFPEFQKGVLETLRAPLEVGAVTITRAKGTATYPANFQLIAAMNPCPCGRLGMEDDNCRCSRHEIARYLKKLSQPILERIDLQVEVKPVRYSDLRIQREGISLRREEERARKERVLEVRALQMGARGKLNMALSHQELTEFGISSDADELLQELAKKLHSSARLFVRTLRVARTIADLRRSELIEKIDILEAMKYRALQSIWKFVEGR